MNQLEFQLLRNLENIKERIKTAVSSSNRNLSDLTMLAVSKNHSIKKINIFQKHGLKVFGESRVQELIEKNEEKPEIDWHFIGHLQRNKVKYLMKMENCSLIHSLDSWRLAEEINKRAANNNRVMPVLLEINIAGEKNKFGIEVKAVNDFLQDSCKLKNLNIIGLMTIAPYVNNPEEVRPIFRKMALIKKDMENKGFKLKELSMGMSNDFEIAIEEGSTMIRIGSSLFGKRGS